MFITMDSKKVPPREIKQLMIFFFFFPETMPFTTFQLWYIQF